MEPLPDHIEDNDLLVRRWQAGDAAALSAAIEDNLEHLRPRMAWISGEPLGHADRVDLIERWAAQWAAGGDLVVGFWLGGRVIGSGGLHWRRATDGPELGYWVIEDVQGRGLATRAARAMTNLAFGHPAVEAVYIANDVSSLASRRIPEKLGFTHLGVVDADPALVAPKITGVNDYWRLRRDEWAGSRPAR